MLTAVLALRMHELFPRLAAFRPVLLIMVLSAALLAFNTSRRTFRASVAYTPSKWVAAYLAWAALTVLTALWPGQALETLIGLTYGIFLYWAYALCAPGESTYLQLSRWLVVLVALYATGVIAIGQLGAGRLESSGAYDSNDLAALVAICLPFALAPLFRAKSGAWKWLWLLPIVPLIMTLALTASRGGILATSAGMVVLVFGFKGVRRAKFVAAACLVALVGWQLAGPTFQARMFSLSNLQADYNIDAESGRLEIWKRGIGYVRDRPITGVGIGNFETAEGYGLRADLRTGKWSAPHNSYVQAFADLGIPGGLIFLGILGSISLRAARWWRCAGRGSTVHRPELLSAMVALMVSALFLSHAYYDHLFAIVGLVAFADRTARRQSSSSLRPQPAFDAPPRTAKTSPRSPLPI